MFLSPWWSDDDVCRSPTSGTPLKKNCVVKKKSVILKKAGCKSDGKVTLTYCSGSCGESSSEWVSQTRSANNSLGAKTLVDADVTFTSAFLCRYSMQKNEMLQSCLCCKAVQTVRNKVNMECGTGKVKARRVVHYSYVKKCSCKACKNV